MTDAERITRALGGDWRHGQGLAPCPICQPEGRRDQRALSVSEKAGKLLLHCHKAGCAVRFGPDGRIIALAEGIETALSVSRASRLTVWATLSTSGMKAVLLPPPPVGEVVIIAADHDEAGLAAAEVTAARLEAEGRAISVIYPPKPRTDFNDLLRGDE